MNPLKTVPVRTFYLEMLEPVRDEVTPPGGDIQVERVDRPAVEFYRTIYEAVGKDWRWVDRKILSDDSLAEIIHDPRVEVYVLRSGGELAGYAELDRRIEGEVELAYFGLAPAYIGKGLGSYLLNWALRRAWSYAPSRVWLHTCEWDHPAALPVYEKAGFRIFDERMIDQVVL